MKANITNNSKRNDALRVLQWPVTTAVALAVLLCGIEQIFWRANSFGRSCLPHHPSKSYESWLSENKNMTIAIVSLSDEADSIAGRSFEGIMEMVLPNKLRYAQQHGYQFMDASHLLDPSRPPSWSKIRAIQSVLQNFDWVLWNDADSLITNRDVALEYVLYSILGNLDYYEMPSILLTKDVIGVNAGMFFIRNTEWSKNFLDLWWGQTSFIRPFGKTKSGDNDALNHLIKSMPIDERKQNVHIVKMRCAFNSNIWTPCIVHFLRLFISVTTLWQGTFSPGDFMVHFAGLNDKRKWITYILDNIELV